MFNLSRHFSTLSLVLILLAAAVLGPLYRQLSLGEMRSMAESRNLAMAHIFENALRQSLDGALAASVGVDGSSIPLPPDNPGLREQVVKLMHDSGIVKVKLYNRLGVAIFSSDRAQAGEVRLDHPGFRQAMNGQVVSSLLHREQLEALEGRRSDIDVFASYIPLPGADRSIEGVLELEQDLTPHTAALWQNFGIAVLGVVLVCSGLYLMQYIVVLRAQRLLHEQAARLTLARDTLEVRVDERTEALRQANAKLEAEIGERRLAESRLNYLAYHDPLTGLANRRCLIEHLALSIAEAAAGKRRLAVLFIDLDQFKQVNDSLGHTVGDELLVAVSSRLLEQVPWLDMLARVGGDEFVGLMENFSEKRDVATLAGEIVAAFEQPFRLEAHELFLSAAVGISLYPGDGENVVELMRNADSAMYRAKAAGRGRFEFYTPDMTEAAQQRIRMENLLRRALESKELSVHLQPQVDTQSGRLSGAEALVRWQSRELGSVPPARFIPIAEESGIIVGLGEWVLQESCRQVMRWQAMGFVLPQVSVNLSVRQLERPEFIDSLARILAESGLEPVRLKLEITESVVMEIKDAFELLERLRDLGVSLALDDFGTGYSSLSYLKHLPVQQLKIDQSFVCGIGRNAGDEAIIRSVMALARSLQFEVVAEGVETPEQANFLGALGCHRLQGYLHGKAVTPSEFWARWAIHP